MSSFIEIAVGLIILVLPTCYLVMKFLSKKYVESYFNQRLEKYRSELKMFEKQLEFNYSKKGVAFGIFFNKKHESYVTYYDLISKANGQVRSLYGFRKVASIELMKVQDIAETIRNAGYSEAITSDYVDRIEEQGISAVKDDINKMLRTSEFNSAENTCYAAKNHLILSRLYFDKTLYDLCISLSFELLSLHSGYELSFQLPGSANLEEQKKHTQNIDQKMEEIIPLMQAELGVGYFEETQICAEES
jgi:hypothetical protein